LLFSSSNAFQHSHLRRSVELLPAGIESIIDLQQNKYPPRKEKKDRLLRLESKEKNRRNIYNG